MYGDFPAEITVCTPYIPYNVWFWPALDISEVQGTQHSANLLTARELIIETAQNYRPHSPATH
jgi:hypothetical protein